MSVITISREFGSVGDAIGERIARTLGYHFVDKEFIVVLLKQYGMVGFGKDYETMPGFWERFTALRDENRSAMVDMLSQVVQGVARHGNVVIQGRSGFAILRGFADVLHVRLQAPLSARIARVMAQQQVTAEQAAATVNEGDRLRMAFVEDFYGVPWNAIQAFDLVVNTGKISPDLAVTWVVKAARALASNPVIGEPATRSIEVDAILASAISTALACETAHN